MDGSRSFFISPSSLLLLLFLLAAGLRGIYEGRSSRGQVQVHAGTRLRSWTNYRWRRGEVTGNVRTGEREIVPPSTAIRNTRGRLVGWTEIACFQDGEGERGGRDEKKERPLNSPRFVLRETRNVHSKLIRWENFSGFSMKSILGRIVEYTFKNYFINLWICCYKYSTLASPQIQFIYIIINNN